MPIIMACIGVYKGENDHLYIGIMAVGIMASLCTKNFKIDLTKPTENNNNMLGMYGKCIDK